MCLSTLAAEFLIRNIYSRQLGSEPGQSSIPVTFFAILAWIGGLVIYFRGFEGNREIDIIARNRGLIYGLGVTNVSLATIIIRPRISEGTSFAIKILPTYIAMVIGSLS